MSRKMKHAIYAYIAINIFWFSSTWMYDMGIYIETWDKDTRVIWMVAYMYISVLAIFAAHGFTEE